MKRIIPIYLLIVFSFCLTACGETNEKEETTKNYKPDYDMTVCTTSYFMTEDVFLTKSVIISHKDGKLIDTDYQEMYTYETLTKAQQEYEKMKSSYANDSNIKIEKNDKTVSWRKEKHGINASSYAEALNICENSFKMKCSEQ